MPGWTRCPKWISSSSSAPQLLSYPRLHIFMLHACRGVRIAVFDIEPPTEDSQDNPITRSRDGVDWFFEGSAEMVPGVLKEVIRVVKDLEFNNEQKS